MICQKLDILFAVNLTNFDCCFLYFVLVIMNSPIEKKLFFYKPIEPNPPQSLFFSGVLALSLLGTLALAISLSPHYYNRLVGGLVLAMFYDKEKRLFTAVVPTVYFGMKAVRFKAEDLVSILMMCCQIVH